MKENYGDLENLKQLGQNKTKSFTVEQLLDGSFKNLNGESRNEVAERMKKSFDRICTENIGKNIAIVSHGAAIKFLLMKWCKLNENEELEYEGKEIKINSPTVLELVMQDGKLQKLSQIY